MRRFSLCISLLMAILSTKSSEAQQSLDSLLPIRGFCIGAPAARDVDSLVLFIKNELAPRRVNTLILRVDYNYQYKSHPELSNSDALSKEDINKLVNACRQNNIRIIPQINLLGHQSWAGTIDNLLRVYPQFDETPHVKMPAKYQWPNADSLYCKSYCPRHPDLHKIVFELIDEICDVFQSNIFHAGMDEVFYIGDAKCPRCGGKDKAMLFADEVRTIRNHLAEKNRELWIWGDRLLDGSTTGMGMWEASQNNTYPAIDMIPKDVVICDWHYERPDKTAVYFALKGFRVMTCPWNNPSVALVQLNDMIGFRNTATDELRPRYYGMMQTVWSNTRGFLRAYYEKKKEGAYPNTDWNTFDELYKQIGTLK